MRPIPPQMEGNQRAAPAVRGGLVSSWRELTFWILLLSSFHSLSAAQTAAQGFGLAQVTAFLIFSAQVAGRLRHLGLRLACWNRISKTAVLSSATAGLVAGLAIVLMAWLCAAPLGTNTPWAVQVAALTVGPILEEVVFRGYLLSLAFVFWPGRYSMAARFASVAIVAVLFSAMHAGRVGITHTQLSCIVLTGMLYGGLRVRYRSTIAAVIAHSAYNATLYAAAWSTFT